MGHNFDKKKNKPEQNIKAKKAKFGIHAEHNIVKYITENLILDEKIANLYFSKKVKFVRSAKMPDTEKKCKAAGGQWNTKNKKCKCKTSETFVDKKCMSKKEAKKAEKQKKAAAQKKQDGVDEITSITEAPPTEKEEKLSKKVKSMLKKSSELDEIQSITGE